MPGMWGNWWHPAETGSENGCAPSIDTQPQRCPAACLPTLPARLPACPRLPPPPPPLQLR